MLSALGASDPPILEDLDDILSVLLRNRLEFEPLVAATGAGRS
jgi:hypothetical protein